MKVNLRAPGALAVVSIVLAPKLIAQDRWLTTIALGTTPRVGAKPGAFHARGSNWGAHAVIGRRLTRSVFLTSSIGMSMQNFEIAPSDTTNSGTYDFHSYIFGAGPSVVIKPAYGFVAVATVQPAMIVSFWGAAAVDACRTVECLSSPTPMPPSKQTETRAGAAFSLMLAYQLVGRNGTDTPYALGFELRGLAAPAHRHTGLPISQLGLYIGMIAGAP